MTANKINSHANGLYHPYNRPSTKNKSYTNPQFPQDWNQRYARMPPEFLCIKCKSILPKASFSKAQLSKPFSKRQQGLSCIDCNQNVKPPTHKCHGCSKTLTLDKFSGNQRKTLKELARCLECMKTDQNTQVYYSDDSQDFSEDDYTSQFKETNSNTNNTHQDIKQESEINVPKIKDEINEADVLFENIDNKDAVDDNKRSNKEAEENLRLKKIQYKLLFSSEDEE